MPQSIFRFAPSPNGRLHLGHAYSALVNQRRARAVDGRLLLRIEDIDLERCTPELEAAMLEDLDWLGLRWDGEIRRQSEHFDRYAKALETLEADGLVYPAVLSRGEIRAMVAAKRQAGEDWPDDPDGSPHYPGDERTLDMARRAALKREAPAYAMRLDMEKALARLGEPLQWSEVAVDGTIGQVTAQPRRWGDVVLARKDVPASYHLCCVVDDAEQEITDVVRGRDLFEATAVHRVLQELLGLPAPRYHHHDLIADDDGRKLSKSRGDVAIGALRQGGAEPADILRLVGLQ